MRKRMIVAIAMAVPAIAWAGKKPSAAAAKRAAKAWLAAATGDDAPKMDALVAVTAVPFTSAAWNVGDESCPWSTVATPDGLAGAVACLAPHIDEHTASSKLRSWKRKDLRGMAFADHDKEAAAIAKDATLVALAPGDCYANNDDEVIVAVIRDDKGAAKVAAVVIQNDLCGE